MNRAVNFTLRVETYLRTIDDFATIAMIRDATSLNYNQIYASLHNLRRNRVVDVIIDPDGIGWWFARPPEDDTRDRHYVEIKQGIVRPRRNWRRGTVKKT